MSFTSGGEGERSVGGWCVVRDEERALRRATGGRLDTTLGTDQTKVDDINVGDSGDNGGLAEEHGLAAADILTGPGLAAVGSNQSETVIGGDIVNRRAGSLGEGGRSSDIDGVGDGGGRSGSRSD